jgi:hypothetical protein
MVNTGKPSGNPVPLRSRVLSFGRLGLSFNMEIAGAPKECMHGGKQLNYCECFKSTYVCRLQTSTNGEYWEAETTG